MPIRLAVRAGVALYLLLLPLRLMAQGAEAELLASDRAASDLSSDSGLVAALTRSLDRGGVLLWPGAPVVIGRDEAKRLMLTLSTRDTMRLTWRPLGVELARDSTFGVTWGIVVITPRLTPGAPHIGSYTAGWRRDAGRWHPVAAGSSRAGDLGWTVGEAVITPETGEPSFSKYLTVWIHPPGRPVRFLTDGGNGRPAAISPR